MGIEIEAQARLLAAGALLGMALALLYDLLRSLRLRLRRIPRLAAALDVLYCGATALLFTAFALRVGDGELRLYAVLAAAVGAAAFFALLSPLLRPLWDFWARVLFELLRLLRLPEKKIRKICSRMRKNGKRLFLFWRHSLIINSYRNEMLRARRRASRREGLRSGGKKRNGKKAKTAHRPAGAVSGARAAVSRGIPSDGHAAKAE